jgi:8-amino-3,8-dideoxy-alpha-D-manno-octulosonate transaminase
MHRRRETPAHETPRIERAGVDRRKFLAATAGFAATAFSAKATPGGVTPVPVTRAVLTGALAIEGGTPVRATRLTGSGNPGTQFYDDQEQTEVRQAVETHSLFRWYGPQTPQKVAKFEQELAKYMDVKYVLAVTSGTAALHCALTALDVGPGDEVVLPALTWYSCYNTILLTGALPVFAEVDESFNLDPEDLEKKINPQTKAVMVVHLYGAPANMDGILAVARRHNLKVLEDSAQTMGGQYKGKRLSTIGDIGIYSFQINKLITAGEGGAVVTNDRRLYERAVRFHDLGLLRPATTAALGKGQMAGFLGTNYRMNEMTGAVMRAQLRKLDTILDAQRRRARYVKEQIKNLPGIRLRTSHDPEGDIGITVCMLLPTKELRDKFAAAMAAENIPLGAPSSSVPLPREPYIENKVAPHAAWPTFNTPRGKSIRYGAECCPRTIDICEHTATLTIGPKYSDRDLADIVTAIAKVHNGLLGPS